MNKYQEALEFLIKASDWDCGKCKECSINKFCHKYEAIQTLQELINEYEKLKEEYQKLKNKETPKKPIHHLISFYRCGNCDNIFQNHHYEEYCPNCGQKLDWSDIS